VARALELWLWFVALLFYPGCLTHLIVLRFGDAFFEHLRTLASALGIFVFSEGVCCLPSGRARHGIPTVRFGRQKEVSPHFLNKSDSGGSVFR
jgi:hypothetical protein